MPAQINASFGRNRVPKLRTRKKPHISLIMGKKTARAMATAKVSWEKAIILAARTLSTILMLSRKTA